MDFTRETILRDLPGCTVRCRVGRVHRLHCHVEICTVPFLCDWALGCDGYAARRLPERFVHVPEIVQVMFPV